MNVEIKNDILTVTIDVSKKAFEAAQPSSTGKSKVLASSHGFSNYATPHGVVGLSLNATTK